MNEYTDLPADMRRAAELLERLNRLYAHKTNCAWSPQTLRHEADVLARPLPGEAS